MDGDKRDHDAKKEEESVEDEVTIRDLPLTSDETEEVRGGATIDDEPETIP